MSRVFTDRPRFQVIQGGQEVARGVRPVTRLHDVTSILGSVDTDGIVYRSEGLFADVANDVGIAGRLFRPYEFSVNLGQSSERLAVSSRLSENGLSAYWPSARTNYYLATLLREKMPKPAELLTDIISFEVVTRAFRGLFEANKGSLTVYRELNERPILEFGSNKQAEYRYLRVASGLVGFYLGPEKNGIMNFLRAYYREQRENCYFKESSEDEEWRRLDKDADTALALSRPFERENCLNFTRNRIKDIPK